MTPLQPTARGFLVGSVVRLLASCLLLIAGHAILRAEEFRSAAIAVARPDWRAALDQLRSEINSQPAVAGNFSFAQRRLPSYDPRAMPALLQLNAVTSPIFAGIGQSPVPVLLPFDTATFLAERNSGAPPSLLLSRYQAGFRPAEMFEAGPAGYDALFTLDPGGFDGLRERTFAGPVEVQITGSILTYEIGDPLAGKGESVKALSAQFPDLRRTIREGHVRYAFTRFGIPYVVSIQCLDSVPRARRLACREASAIAERFLKALRVAGGRPSRPRFDIAAGPTERPSHLSPDFTYRPPGDIIASSGYRGQGGHADFNAYAQIRFPLEQAPAFANSQSFLNWGDCFHRGRLPPPSGVKGAVYRCRSNDKPLVFDESAAENYSYPWQDNFCEARDFGVGQCASGFGHQGQDIRPSSCALRNDGADRCEPNRHAIVAVRDGVLIRTPKQQAATLLINTSNEHVRFRYLHMHPAQMDADGVVSGRHVTEGEKIGMVSNYQDHAGGTTNHLHFDVQVFTRDGWLWVNPYVTLISAYERLIGARGREIAPVATPALAHALPEDVLRPEPQEGGEN
jgi:hypothetical protein